MNIKYQWEKEDIQIGMYVICDSYPESCVVDDIGGLSTVAYKVGYQSSTSNSDPSIISLTDGYIFTLKRKDGQDREDAVLDFLNSDKGYRPAKAETLKAIIDYQAKWLCAERF